MKMKVTTAPKKFSSVVVVVVDQNKVARGHWVRPSGAGKHADKRSKRLKTRGAATSHSMSGW